MIQFRQKMAKYQNVRMQGNGHATELDKNEKKKRSFTSRRTLLNKRKCTKHLRPQLLVPEQSGLDTLASQTIREMACTQNRKEAIKTSPVSMSPRL